MFDIGWTSTSPHFEKSGSGAPRAGAAPPRAAVEHAPSRAPSRRPGRCARRGRCRHARRCRRRARARSGAPTARRARARPLDCARRGGGAPVRRARAAARRTRAREVDDVGRLRAALSQPRLAAWPPLPARRRRRRAGSPAAFGGRRRFGLPGGRVGLAAAALVEHEHDLADLHLVAGLDPDLGRPCRRPTTALRSSPCRSRARATD